MSRESSPVCYTTRGAGRLYRLHSFPEFAGEYIFL
jgi:hypothetical protein